MILFRWVDSGVNGRIPRAESCHPGTSWDPASSWHKATSDCLLADGPCSDLTGLGASVGHIGCPLTARLGIWSVKIVQGEIFSQWPCTETCVFSVCHGLAWCPYSPISLFIRWDNGHRHTKLMLELNENVRPCPLHAHGCGHYY